jgi:ketosteroid isomerase-like protein
MSNDDKIERMRRGYEAFGKADLDGIRDLLAPDVVWHFGGDNPLTGDYKGIDEVFGLFGKMFEMTAGDMNQEVHDLLASDKHGVAITHLRASRPDGRTLDVNQVAIYHSDDQNRVSEAWLLPEDAAAANAFFA